MLKESGLNLMPLPFRSGASYESSQPFWETYVLRLAVCRRLPFYRQPVHLAFCNISQYYIICTIVSRFYAVLQPVTHISLEPIKTSSLTTPTLIPQGRSVRHQKIGIISYIHDPGGMKVITIARGTIHPPPLGRGLLYPLTPRVKY